MKHATASKSKPAVAVAAGIVAGFLTLTGLAPASPIVEQQDRLEIDWTRMQIRFYGESMTKAPEGEDSYKPAESRAWQDGLNYILEAVGDLNRERNIEATAGGQKDLTDSTAAAQAVSRSTYSYNTTYFASGLVRVYLENRLARALGLTTVKFKHAAPVPTTGIDFSGIVLKTDRSIPPRATYRIVDENGNRLFGVEDMAEDAYRKSLMGRWFKSPTSGELAPVVGENAIEIRVIAKETGEFVVPRDQWDQALAGYLPLLVNGRIAIALP